MVSSDRYWYIVYLIRNTEAVTVATKEIWNSMFCVVGAERSFQGFDCEPDSGCAQTAQKEGTVTLETMNQML